MSWADDVDEVPNAAVHSFKPPVVAGATLHRPSLLAPSLPEGGTSRDSRDGRTPRPAVAVPRALDNSKSKGQGQRDDIVRMQQKLSNATGPVTNIYDRMGSDGPWSKSATSASTNAAAVGTPRQSHAAPEPQRKPLVLAPRTQPLPAFSVADQSSARIEAPATPVASAAAAVSKPITPKSDPFGGARPIDSSVAAERRQKILEEKAQQEASRQAEVQAGHEKPAKQQTDKQISRHQDERPSSARGGWGANRGRSGDRASGDTVEVKILQRSTEKLAISHPPPAVVQPVDAPDSSPAARPAHGAGWSGKGAKASTPREPKRTESDHAPAPPSEPTPPQPKQHVAAAAGGAAGRGKGPPKSPNLGPAASSAVIAAAAAAADGTPSNRGKSKKTERGGKGKAQGADDLPLPFD